MIGSDAHPSGYAIKVLGFGQCALHLDTGRRVGAPDGVEDQQGSIMAQRALRAGLLPVPSIPVRVDESLDARIPAVRRGEVDGEVDPRQGPGAGDVTRSQLRDIPDVDALYFTMLNSNKRSLTLDTKKPEGKEVLEKLIKVSDVMVENFGPGALDRMGFTWERIMELNPKMILADIQLADGSSGIDAVNDILSSEALPVIFITAFPERLLTGERPEPTFLVTKPFNPDMVKALISQALFFDEGSRVAA